MSAGTAFNLHLPNCPEFIALWFAAARMGAIMTPTNVALTADELTYIVDHSESRLIVTDADQLPVAAAVQDRAARQFATCCRSATSRLGRGTTHRSARWSPPRRPRRRP